MSIYVSGNRLASKLFNAFRDVRLWDFSWPRGVVNVKPAVVEPAVPDTAAADAGAKSAKPKSAMDAYAAAQTGREQKPAHRRPRPRLNHIRWRPQRPTFLSCGSRGWQHTERDQFRRVSANAIGITFAPACIDPQDAVVGPVGLPQPCNKCSDTSLPFSVFRRKVHPF